MRESEYTMLKTRDGRVAVHGLPEPLSCACVTLRRVHGQRPRRAHMVGNCSGCALQGCQNSICRRTCTPTYHSPGHTCSGVASRMRCDCCYASTFDRHKLPLPSSSPTPPPAPLGCLTPLRWSPQSRKVVERYCEDAHGACRGGYCIAGGALGAPAVACACTDAWACCRACCCC